MNTSTPRRRRRARGFSLIEVAIAMGLLSIVGVGSIGLMTGMMRANRDARMRSQAATYARSAIDELISLTEMSTKADMFDKIVISAGYSMPGTRTDDFGALKRKVTLGTASGNLVPLTLTVSWDRESGTNTILFSAQMNLVRPN